MKPTLRQLIEGATKYYVRRHDDTNLDENEAWLARLESARDLSERWTPEVALAVLEALEECRAPLDGYIHGDNEITVPTLHNMLNAVDRALSRLNAQAQPSPAP